MFSAETKAALCEHLPQLVIVDTIGSSEGVMGSSMTTKGATAETARFSLLPTTKVFTEDGREVKPGSGELGLVAVGGNVPLGYYKDEARTAATFKEFDGVRYSLPGDWATVADDGSIVLLGRGGSCINTGGEKVFPEEVEEAIKTHPAVDDCLVFGVPDESFGQAVAAVVAPVPGGAVTEREIIDHLQARLAAYKAPRQVAVVATVPRTPAGKADYPGARAALGV